MSAGGRQVPSELRSSGMRVALIDRRDTPVIATAIHAGHELDPCLERRMALDPAARLREEDPYTDRLADIGASRVVACLSRFSLDLNRPRERAVYRCPDDAWGLQVWDDPPDASALATAEGRHEAFYAAVDELVEDTVERHGYFVLMDVHSYNHRRQGPHEPADDPSTSPEVNLGTRTLDRANWESAIEAFLGGMREAGFDARENVKFGGGELVRHVNERHGAHGCALAVEFRKDFMDEWSGSLDEAALGRARLALQASVHATARAVRAAPR